MPLYSPVEERLAALLFWLPEINQDTLRNQLFTVDPVQSQRLCPGRLCPGILCPGRLCPGILCPGSLCPGSLCPGRLCPGRLCPGRLCPGRLCPVRGFRLQKLLILFIEMDCAALLLLALSGFLLHVACTESVTAVYGETIEVPCHNGAPAPDDLMFIKWKYETNGGSSGDLLIKQAQSDKPTVQATDDYAQRVSIDSLSSLLISQASLRDQRTFTCMVVSETNVMEYPVSVSVNKKPSSVEILDKSAFLRKDKLTSVGTCVAADANPAATITWQKNGVPLVADGKAVLITRSLKLDPSTGLSTVSSTLQYTATTEDMAAVFSCVSTHQQSQQDTVLEQLPVHYPTEKLRLVTLPEGPFVEGENVTLQCNADGNPPPTSFIFHLKDNKVLVENSDSFTLSAISREDSGDYGCTLADNEDMRASQSMLVNYLDLSLSPTGMVVKMKGDTLSVEKEISSSGNATMTWTKNGRPVKEPGFRGLSYADAGVYTFEVSISGLTRHQSFQLQVEGKPKITSLTEHLTDDDKHKVLSCEAEGVPEPSFLWSINYTNEKSSYMNGRATHQITVSSRAKQSVTCSVSNKLGEHTMRINVSSVFQEENKERDSSFEERAKLVGGVVGALLIVAVMVGIIYWLYKRSRRGSWKTREQDVAACEESLRLEENQPSG